MTTGKFIVVEGLEGAGKTTAVKTIIEMLANTGINNVITTREPGGTPLAEKMRALVKNPHPNENLTDMAELLLMYAARIQLVENVIKPALAQGAYVVGDRHDMSSQAYQGGGRGFDNNTMLSLRDLVLADFKPDVVFYMDIDPILGLERARARGELDRIERMQIDFFQRIRAKYLELAAQNSNVIIINASLPLAEVTLSIKDNLTTWLNNQ